jgi:hypothetical protein
LRGLASRDGVPSRHEHHRDKVITRPYLGREAVRFSSILHADLKGRTAAAG